jgi:peptidoglycan lytic transglycosylase D
LQGGFVRETMVLAGASCRFGVRSRSAAITLVALVWILALGQAGPARAESQVPFPCPASIEPNVHFWVDVFATYSVRDFVLVDRDDVRKVYYVFHLPGYGEPARDDLQWVNAYLKDKYRGILMRLASGAEPVGFEERRVAGLFKGEPPTAYARAADNLRVQEGLRERFRNGLLRSRYYQPTMERIFREFDLPVELVTLAQVESGFHSRARSSAGAVGIWQFTRSTGRRYMRITRWHDDRLDPIRSTEAAARLLSYNYALLGSWPLAITSYDYGLGATARAAEMSGNDFSQMVESYNGPRFGFAVKNYYAEFLAALQVHSDEEKYFPGIQYEPAIAPDPPRRVRRVAHLRHHRYRHYRYRHYRHRSHRRGFVRRVSAHSRGHEGSRGNT